MYQAHITFDLSYGNHERQRVDVCVPRDQDDAPLVLCLHSGWFQLGKHELMRPVMMSLAEAGFASASIGYRLCTNDVHAPELLEDCMNGISAAVDEAALLGANIQSPCLLGSGAGGLLALNIALRQSNAYAGIITCGTTPQLSWEGCNPAIQQALDQFSKDHDAYSPLKQDCSSLPPLLLLHGDSDPEVPVTLARDLHAHCIDQNVASTFSVLSGTKHRFLEENDSRVAQSAMKRIIPWLSTRFNDDGDEIACGEAQFMQA